MRVILRYWFGDVAFDLESGAASTTEGRPLGPFVRAFFELVKPRAVIVKTPLGDVGLELPELPDE